MKLAKKYYAVARGKVKKPTIFTSWDDCKKATTGYSKPKFKGFETYEDALKYLKSNCGNVSPELVNPSSASKEKSQAARKKKKEIKKEKPKKTEMQEKLDTYRSIRKNGNGSTGENVVEMYLKLMKYRYKKEYVVSIGGYEYRFDFAIFDFDKLIGFIEFDGIQHFEAVSDFGGNAGLRNTQFRDSRKDDYCRKNNLKLLRIKYSDGHKSKNLIQKSFPKSRRIESDDRVVGKKTISVREMNRMFGINLSKDEILKLHRNDALGDLMNIGTHRFSRIGKMVTEKGLQYVYLIELKKTYAVSIKEDLQLEKKAKRGAGQKLYRVK